jgi:hypothetical protein
MPLYWFFDLPVVAQQNLFLKSVEQTETFLDVRRAVAQVLKTTEKRPPFRIPLE